MFKVKAVYDYSSPHEDDLNFKQGQIITVTEEEGDDWYVGEYLDDAGAKHEGLFPSNFVEKYEPAPPPRPNRASRFKPLEQPAVQAVPPPPVAEQHEPEIVQHEEQEAPQPQPPPVQVQVPPPTVKTEPTPMSPISPPSATSSKAPELPPAPAVTEAARSSPAPAAKKAPPPPVAAKSNTVSNAFRDRIAAFNAPTAAPVQPFKPGGAPSNFIKKPFVAPPPSRDAFVPTQREAPQVKSYRREEDPEIAERQAQDQDAAERAGLIARENQNTNEDEEDNQPKMSLKERIALLQKQQHEQAERVAAATHKDKPKRPPPKKRTESHEAHAEDSEDTELEKVPTATSRPRESMDHSRPPRTSHDIRSPDSHHARDLVSENDADQSGADNTEDAEGSSTTVEEDDDRSKQQHPPLPIRAPNAPSQEPDVGDEQGGDEEEEEEEDEMDAETRRKLELRERMAKMSGGMGMPGMFGAVPMPPKKKKTAEKQAEESEERSIPQQRVAMFPMGGMPSVRSPEQENRQFTVEKEDEPYHPITSSHHAEDVPDVEDVTPQYMQRTPTGERPPPIPSDRRPMPPPVPAGSRPVPPPPPQIASPGHGYESGDEGTDTGAHTLSPISMPPNKRSSYFGTDEPSYDPQGRRMSSFPIGSPATSTAGRPPPPPPPTQAPPSRSGEPPSRKIDRTEGETDYEGDYDTDIAPGADHKEALKAHTRIASIDDSTVADEPSSARSPTAPHGIPPLPPSVPRAVPPPPPQERAPPRRSTDGPRGIPPVPPPVPARNDRELDEDYDEYDPYSYNSPKGTAPPPAPRGMPPPPQSQPPPPQNRPPPPMPPSMPPVPQYQAAESSGDDLYDDPPPRKSHDRPPPPPPQAPPHQQAPPLPPQERAAPPPPPQERAPPPLPPQERAAPSLPPTDNAPRAPTARKSLDVNRALAARSSMDQPRPSMNEDFIASDIDLGHASHWWTQPKLLPPALHSRKDVLVDMKESQSGNLVEKAISVLYQDYSQTTILTQFDLSNVSDVQFEQNHMPPPPRQRPDQLEAAYEQFGRQIAKVVESKQNTVVGSGTPQSLIDELLRPYPDALPPVSTRAYGALVYSNLANASTLSYDEIRPGDIITFRNAKFQGSKGPMHAKYSMEAGKSDHVGVVIDWDGSKKKVRVWEQGREHKKVKPESFKMGDLKSGEVRVWRVMGRGWVGW